MTLDFDCFRTVLLTLEKTLIFEPSDEDDDAFDFSFPFMAIQTLYANEDLQGFSPEEVFYAVHNLEQAGYINASCLSADNSISECAISDITFEGHMFLKDIKSETVWKKVKSSIVKAGGDVSISVLSALAASFVKQLVGLNP